MGTSTPTITLERPELHWSLASRAGFRFCFAYFGLYSLSTEITLAGLLLPFAIDDIPNPATLPPMRQIVFWTAAHVFGVKLPLIYWDNGSGDKIFNWVLTFLLLVVATFVAGIWSILDRKRSHYIALYKWFRLFIRFGLAGQMVSYGLAKVIPTQMPFPSLTRLLTPYGNLSPMGVLWSAIGASPIYEIFGGCAEVLGGVLLFIPRTTTLGALLCLADMVQVFILNMTYDVPVKLFSFHLILMSVFLLAPDCPRLTTFFFLNRPAGPPTQPQLFLTRRANRVALTVQVLFGAWLVASNAYWARHSWQSWGDGRPESPLYGIWNVEEFSIDRQFRAPLITDAERWRRAIFDSPDLFAVERMDDSFDYYRSAIDVNSETLALTKAGDANPKGNFTFKRVARDQLILDGAMDGHEIQMQLRLLDRKKFLLVSRGFHWTNESSFNPGYNDR